MNNDPTPEEFWEHQSRLPIRQRSLGWWAEVGFSTIVLTIFLVSLPLLFLLGALGVL